MLIPGTNTAHAAEPAEVAPGATPAGTLARIESGLEERRHCVGDFRARPLDALAAESWSSMAEARKRHFRDEVQVFAPCPAVA